MRPSHFGVLGADAFAIRYVPGQAASAGPALAAAAAGLALQPTPLTGIEGAISDAFGRVFGLFDTLALLAVLIAGLGIINTLTMNVYERVREIGILRAAGMTRRQVWRMVVVEAGILGVVGAFLGCLAGVVLGFVLSGVAGLGGPGGEPHDPLGDDRPGVAVRDRASRCWPPSSRPGSPAGSRSSGPSSSSRRRVGRLLDSGRHRPPT